MSNNTTNHPPVANSKTTTALTSDDINTIKELFTVWNDKIINEEFSKALITAERILKIDPNDMDALRCKVYCLMQLGKWSLVYSTIQSFKNNSIRWSEIKMMFAFERIYFLYKNHRIAEASKVMEEYKTACQNSMKEGCNGNGGAVFDKKFMLLEAQLLGKLSKHENAGSKYTALLQEEPDNELLMVNALASAASIDDNIVKLPLPIEIIKSKIEESYELGFNMACFLMERGEKVEALKYLTRAEAACKNELRSQNNFLSGAALENHSEVIPFKVQRAYILQSLGENDEAEKLYTNVLNHAREETVEIDATVVAVAINNLYKNGISYEEFQNYLREIEVRWKAILTEKLSNKQALGITVNTSLQLLNEEDLQKCRDYISSALSKYANCMELKYVAAALQIKVNKFKKCFKQLELLHEEGVVNVTTKLGFLYFYIKSKEYTKAADVLMNIANENHRVKPAYFLLLLELKEMQNDAEGLKHIFSSGYNYFVNLKNQKASSLTVEQKELLREFCNSSWRVKSWDWLTHFCKLMIELVDGRDLQFVSLLVAAASYNEIEIAEQFSGKLRAALPSLASFTDPEELMEMDWQTLVLKTKSRGDTNKEKQKNEVNKTKKVRKRRRYPRGFNINTPGPLPDPERWLPKHMRAAHKRKQRRRRDTSRTQGSMPQTEASNRPSGPSTAHVSVASDSFKKKKGKRPTRR